jgi:hypothetical protein
MHFANIEKAHLEIAYDNGGINRDRSEKNATRELRRFLPTLPYDRDQMTAIDAWLGSLTPDQLETLCAGEQSEQDEIYASAPPFTESVIVAIFDHVC